MPKILFIAPHRLNRSPSQRYRFEQYLDFLSLNDWEWELSYLLNEKDDKIFYAPKHFIKKVYLNLKFIAHRFKDIKKAENYDVIFVQREAIFLGLSYFEKKFSKVSKLVFDFDDAIWLPNVSNSNRKFVWLKNPSKVKSIIKYADAVIAGNRYLASFAMRYNNDVTVIPTTIDTDKYSIKDRKKNSERVCIGWTGSLTTLQHFEIIISVLKQLKAKYKDKICIRVIADRKVEHTGLEIDFVKWNAETEVEDLSRIDIGLMPLPDDEWSKGKCGLKALQYMALGVPAVVSPVGVNTEIVEDGINGFIAENEDEWIEKLSLLIENPEIRKKLGTKARQTVEEKYSVDANKHKYLEVLNSLVK
jgi:glycosyltransferase involved in cell wall biosynthesis